MPIVQLPMPMTMYEDANRGSAFFRLNNMYPRKMPEGSKSGLILANMWGARHQHTFASLVNNLGYFPRSQQTFALSNVATVMTLFTTTDGFTWTSRATKAGVGSSGVGPVAAGDDMVMFRQALDIFYTHYLSGAWTGTIAEFAAGTDWLDVTYLDGYFIVTDGVNIFIATSNGAGSYNFDATEFAVPAGTPGDITAVKAVGRYVWVLKETGAEVFYNSGDADFPFERVSDAIFFVPGPITPLEATVAGDRLYWMTEDRSLYRTNGLGVERVDTINRAAFVNSRIHTIRLEEGFMILAEATIDGALCTIGYCDWADSWVMISLSSGYADVLWASIDLTAKRNIIATGSTGTKPYVLTPDKFKWESSLVTELDMEREVSFGPLHANGDWFFIKSLYIDMNVQAATSVTATLYYSDDGGATWSSGINSDIGTTNGPNRAYWRRLGRARDRIFRVNATADAPMHIYGAWADIEVGVK